jgi:hypothetical protein
LGGTLLRTAATFDECVKALQNALPSAARPDRTAEALEFRPSMSERKLKVRGTGEGDSPVPRTLMQIA